MKKILLSLLRLYFVPFRYNSRSYFRVKDIFYTNASEHLHRLLNMMKDSIDPDKNIIADVGAADGSTAVFFSQHIPHAKVYAFEPNKAIWPRLDKRVAGNPNIIVKKVALAEKEGNAQLYRTQNDLSSSVYPVNQAESKNLPKEHQDLLADAETFDVTLTTLDTALAGEQHILCIKLDVQGYELNVLKGGLKTLEKTRFILVEMNNHQLYDGGCQYYEVDAFLRSQHFRLADIIVSYRTQGKLLEYDAIYEKASPST